MPVKVPLEEIATVSMESIVDDAVSVKRVWGNIQRKRRSETTPTDSISHQHDSRVALDFTESVQRLPTRR